MVWAVQVLPFEDFSGVFPFLLCLQPTFPGFYAHFFLPSWPSLSLLSRTLVIFGTNTGSVLRAPSSPCFRVSPLAPTSFRVSPLAPTCTERRLAHMLSSKVKMSASPDSSDPAYLLILFWSLFIFAGEKAEAFFVPQNPFEAPWHSRNYMFVWALPLRGKRAVGTQ